MSVNGQPYWEAGPMPEQRAKTLHLLLETQGLCQAIKEITLPADELRQRGGIFYQTDIDVSMTRKQWEIYRASAEITSYHWSVKFKAPLLRAHVRRIVTANSGDHHYLGIPNELVHSWSMTHVRTKEPRVVVVGGSAGQWLCAVRLVTGEAPHRALAQLTRQAKSFVED